MIPISALWLPILLSALAVWIASAIVWTVLPHRQKEFKQLPDEDAVRRALKGGSGEYMIPFAGSHAAGKDPEFLRKCEEGPTGFVRLLAPKRPAMGKPMALSFTFYVVVGVTVAYLAGRVLAPGTEYLAVFRVTGTVAWAAYFLAAVPDSIWFGKPWTSTGKLLVEALIYGALTGGFFGWMWPATA
jgi:hypothetical protein